MDFKDALNKIATAAPGINLRMAIDLATAFSSVAPDLSTSEGRVEFARSLSVVTSCLPDRKIQAIKNLREQAIARGHGMSLIDAKNAVEALPGGKFL